jgi:ubiquinone/menaquinone biosynthesis C-methylase UbiE
MTAMNEFLADYESATDRTRYVAAALPDLPFPDDSFDLALCSHFLFLYSTDLSLDFHRRSILDLFRVAAELRIFPLLDMDGRPSPHVQPLLRDLPRHSLQATIEPVEYEFQRGGNEMLRIVRDR